MKSSQIAEIFENIAGLLEMRGDPPYTVRAYQRVARTVERHSFEMDRMVGEAQDLKELPGVGKAISDKITELVTTGKLQYYERLKSEFPDGILELIHIPGLGPKTTVRVWKELGVTTVAELEEAINQGRLVDMPRMGEKTADNILRHIQLARTRDQRMPIARAMPISEQVISLLRERCPSISRLVAAGSLRRFEETIGDIDLVCTTDHPQQVLDTLLGMPNVAEVLGHGGTKASVVLDDGIQVDLRVVEDGHFGSLLQYFTGSQQHTIQLRDCANKMGCPSTSTASPT